MWFSVFIGEDMNIGQPSQSVVRRYMLKLSVLLFLWIAMEVGAYIGVAYLLGEASYAFWLIVGFMFIGYVIQPSTKEARLAHPMRAIVGKLLFIPTYLTKIIALVVAIKPLRLAIQKHLLSKLLPPEISRSFSAEDMSRFADFMKGNMSGARAGTGFSEGAERRAQGDSGEVIDIDVGVGDYEVKKSGQHDIVIEKAHGKGPKSIAAEEIIDVEHEWKSH